MQLQSNNAMLDNAVTTQIRWTNPQTHEIEITTIGFEQGQPEPYWIRYLDYNGNMQLRRFAGDPWQSGSTYQTFLEEMYAGHTK